MLRLIHMGGERWINPERVIGVSVWGDGCALIVYEGEGGITRNYLDVPIDAATLRRDQRKRLRS